MTNERPVAMPGSVSISDRQPHPGLGHPATAGAAETATMSGAGSVMLPAGIINPSLPIRNIKMKFAVLIGLIQVGEVSNRDIVETVLNLVSKRIFFFPPTGLYDWMLLLNSPTEPTGVIAEYFIDLWQTLLLPRL